MAVLVLYVSYTKEKKLRFEIDSEVYYDDIEDPLFLSEGEEVVNGKYRRIKND
jgi:hypothetical protein